jgi:hypothetical protein
MEIPDFSDLSLWGGLIVVGLIVVGGSGPFPGTTIFLEEAYRRSPCG